MHFSGSGEGCLLPACLVAPAAVALAGPLLVACHCVPWKVGSLHAGRKPCFRHSSARATASGMLACSGARCSAPEAQATSGEQWRCRVLMSAHKDGTRAGPSTNYATMVMTPPAAAFGNKQRGQPMAIRVDYGHHSGCGFAAIAGHCGFEIGAWR